MLSYVVLYPAVDEANAAYKVWLDVRAKRDEVLTEKQNKKPAPYKHVKVDEDFVPVTCRFIQFESIISVDQCAG